MRLTRGLVVLAIIAALSGAPSSASAAVNELSSSQVSPGSGSVTTLFTFRVRYDGGFPAATVSVTVAGLTVPMVLESGSLTAGWWTGASVLPVGAWSTSFLATATRGPAATVVGPVVTVAGSATPPPVWAGPTSPSSGATPASAPVGDPVEATTPPEEAAATTEAIAGPEPEAPGPNSAPLHGSDGADAPSDDGTVAKPGPGGSGDDGAAAPAGNGAPAASPFTLASPAHGATRIRSAADTESRDERATSDGLVANVLLLGLVGVASVAIIGTLLLIASRRREPKRATLTTAPSVADDALRRRMARSGGARPADDPIVAALGVDDEMAARRAIRRARREIGDDERPGRRPKGR